MLFRTKLVAAISALGAVAIICAALLILSSQRSAYDQKRTTLAYESLSGYLQLSGSVFRTFKQARRDLVSGSGQFAFDLSDAQARISNTLDEIETVSRDEAEFSDQLASFDGLAQVSKLRQEVAIAFDEIQAASGMILAGEAARGKLSAIETLEGRVDARIATLIEDAISAERKELAEAQADIQFINRVAQIIAWASVAVALILFALVLSTLVRRLNVSLGALEAGAEEYAQDNLDHRIDLPGNDELSAVANRFNGMAQQILTKRDALENARQELEQRVQERTSELSQANNELRERDQLRRQFFADIGHELRTPVTAIRGEAEVALRGKSEQTQVYKTALKTIVALSEQLTESVSDVFLIARGQAGVLDFRNHSVDIGGVAEQAVAQMQSLAADSGATIALDLGAAGVEVEGDTNRLTQLTRILISNALTHSPPGVGIEIATRLTQETVELVVSDNGPGIAKADHARIFDRYVRVRNGGLQTSTGTGLGLAIAKSIVQAHGGDIALMQSASGGTCITAGFPRLDAQAA